MNKTIYWIVASVAILLLIVFFVADKMLAPSSVSNPVEQNSAIPVSQNTTSSYTVPPPGATPSTSSTKNKMALATRAGAAIVVNDFIHNGVTAADIENPGQYYLAGSIGYCIANVGCPSGATSTQFTIVYTASGQVFHIILVAEPLGASRLAAEQFLTAQLGIDKNLLCNLYYYVSVPASVNSLYANTNLGFDFCPGAVQLP